MSYRVRAASPADLDSIVGFNLALARETEDRTLDPARLEEGVRTFLGDPSWGRYFLAIPSRADAEGDRARDPAPVGQIMLTYEFSDWRNGPIWWIQSVYIHPEHRRRGLYRALHRHVRDRAREAGAVGLRLYVDRGNEVAQATYQSLGMERARYDMYEEIWG